MPTSFRKTVDVILQKQKERGKKRDRKKERHEKETTRNRSRKGMRDRQGKREERREKEREREKVAPLLREKDGGTTVWRGVLTVAAVTRE